MLLSLFFTVSSIAQELTPKQYINLEIAVRSITLEEVRERAIGNKTNTNYKQLIKNEYQEYGTNAGSHLKYGNKHKQAIRTWLKNNPNKQSELDTLTSEFQRLVNILG